jgi:hypothetical protein
MRKLMVTTMVLAMLAVGCGSGGDDDGDAAETTTTTAEEATTTEASGEPQGDEQAWVEALAAKFSTGELEDGALVLTEEQATCVGEGWVEAIGIDALTASGVTPEEAAEPNSDVAAFGADEAGAQAMVASFRDCDVDIVAKVAESLTASSPNPEEDRICAEENLEVEAVEALLIAVFQGGTGDAEFEAIRSVLVEACEP